MSHDVEPPLRPGVDRFIAVVIVLAAVVLTVVLLQVRPDARGLGTHEQLGLLPCSWPQGMGIPCPTCGYTTAAAHLVHLQPLQALAVQPFGALLAATGLALAAYAAWCLASGRSLMRFLASLPYGTILVWTIVLFLASWGYKYATFTP